MTGSPLGAVRRVSAVFDQLSIRYVVVGSVASSLQGIPRATVDADFVVDLHLESLSELISSLSNDFYISEQAALEAIRREGMFNLIELSSGYKVDLHLAGEDPYEQTKLARARAVALPSGEQIRVASAEDVILSKLRWYEIGNRISQRQWKDVLGVIQFQPSLDIDYLVRWGELLEISDLVAQALREVEQ